MQPAASSSYLVVLYFLAFTQGSVSIVYLPEAAPRRLHLTMAYIARVNVVNATDATIKDIERTVWHYANGGSWILDDHIFVLTMGGSGTSGMMRFLDTATGEVFAVLVGVHNWKPWCDVVTDLTTKDTCMEIHPSYYAGGKRSGIALVESMEKVSAAGKKISLKITTEGQKLPMRRKRLERPKTDQLIREPALRSGKTGMEPGTYGRSGDVCILRECLRSRREINTGGTPARDRVSDTTLTTTTMSSRKRKYRTESRPTPSHNPTIIAERAPSPDPALYVHAYEADIIRGPRAALAARSLEVSQPGDKSFDIGDALIKWDRGQQAGAQAAFPQDEDDFALTAAETGDRDSHAVWVDRYDVRLLLDSLPPVSPSDALQSVPASPGGWSDLPSDNEDVFFLSADEVADFRREKRRRRIEQAREERLQARLAEDDEPVGQVKEDVWGGSDEEPDEPQRELMRRTATHILSSPNPAQLEMRILANHGGDPRFAFLRGRWSRVWQILKGKVRLEKEEEEKRLKAGKTGLGALAGYGDSDAESGDSDDHQPGETERAEPPPEIPYVPSPPPLEAEEAVKEARRERAREWAEKRRLLKERPT
ncbi:hypothetical protein LshimejAT787_1201270 [Lyophyllum shimeji]|uniref:Uncharacterized protein n=1 Tax=Lyophyllum shimeji TaxID=47721 RepID=A0A9P3PW48_LYOSH|nr:hypothetical protein LshimejAT787_1201270 [Lyophyllum shimeji]